MRATPSNISLSEPDDNSAAARRRAVPQPSSYIHRAEDVDGACAEKAEAAMLAEAEAMLAEAGWQVEGLQVEGS